MHIQHMLLDGVSVGLDLRRCMLNNLVLCFGGVKLLYLSVDRYKVESVSMHRRQGNSIILNT